MPFFIEIISPHSGVKSGDDIIISYIKEAKSDKKTIKSVENEVKISEKEAKLDEKGVKISNIGVK